MKNLKVPAFVTVLILTTITLVFWVFFGVYRVFTKAPSPNIPANIMEPLSPTLNKDTLNQLQNRTYFEEGAVPTIPVLTPTPQTIISPQVTITPTPESTISATPTATVSGSPTP